MNMLLLWREIQAPKHFTSPLVPVAVPPPALLPLPLLAKVPRVVVVVVLRAVHDDPVADGGLLLLRLLLRGDGSDG